MLNIQRFIFVFPSFFFLQTISNDKHDAQQHYDAYVVNVLNTV